MRRRMSPSWGSSPLVARSSNTGWLGARSKLAVTWPCGAPRRTSAASPRPPMARENASSKIDLPAPVSPVSAERPGPNSRSSLSIRTMSRIDSAASMADGSGRLAVASPGLGDPRPLVLLRLCAVLLQKTVGVVVPFAVREVVAKHGGRSFGLVDDAQRHIGLGQTHQGFFHLLGGLVVAHHDAEAIDGGEIIVMPQVVTAHRHLARGKQIAQDAHSVLRLVRIARSRIALEQLLVGVEGLSRGALIAFRIEHLNVIGHANDVLGEVRLGRAGMEGEVAVGGRDGGVIFAGLVISVGRHDDRLARFLRIRVIDVDFLVFLGGVGIAALVDHRLGLAVDDVGRIVVLDDFLFAPQGAAADEQAGWKGDAKEGDGTSRKLTRAEPSTPRCTERLDRIWNATPQDRSPLRAGLAPHDIMRAR